MKINPIHRFAGVNPVRAEEGTRHPGKRYYTRPEAAIDEHMEDSASNNFDVYCQRLSTVGVVLSGVSVVLRALNVVRTQKFYWNSVPSLFGPIYSGPRFQDSGLSCALS